MNASYRELTERIRGEMPDLEHVVQRSLRVWAEVRKAPGEYDPYLDSVALNLHGFYSGLERLFELVARHVDQAVPAGETWHRDLLEQVAHDRTNVRPAVIGQETARTLDEFRRFRHLVRNVYTINLVPEKMDGLLSVLPGLWLAVRAELLAFAEFLEELAQASRSDEEE